MAGADSKNRRKSSAVDDGPSRTGDAEALAEALPDVTGDGLRVLTSGVGAPWTGVDDEHPATVGTATTATTTAVRSNRVRTVIGECRKQPTRAATSASRVPSSGRRAASP